MANIDVSRFKIALGPESEKVQGLRVGDVVLRKYYDNTTQYYSLMLVEEIGNTAEDGDFWIGKLLDGMEPGATGTELLDFVRVTNLFDEDRMGALYLTGSDNNAPFMDVVDALGKDESKFWPTSISQNYGYWFSGASYGSDSYSEDNRVYRLTRNATPAEYWAFRPRFNFGDSVDILEVGRKYVISYRYRASKNISVTTNIANPGSTNRSDFWADNFTTDWQYQSRVFECDFVEIDTAFQAFFGVVLSDGDWVEYADFSIIPIDSLINRTTDIKSRHGKLDGVVDKTFGALKGYGSYVKRLYATEDVNIAGTLTAGDKDGQGAVFYAGRISKNLIKNSNTPALGIARATLTVEPTLSPQGVIENIQKITPTGETDPLVNMNPFTIGDTEKRDYTLSIWIKSDVNTEASLWLYGTNGGDSIGSTTTWVQITSEWKRVVISGKSKGDNVSSILTPRIDLKEDTPTSDDAIYIWGAQLEYGDQATQLQPTDDVLSDDDNFGMWAKRGGFGGTIQNPILKLNEDGTIVGGNDSLILRPDGSAEFNGTVVFQGAGGPVNVEDAIADAKSEAISTAATDATNKANQAETNAAADATAKADAAELAAAADATAKADQALVDAKADATAKATAAQQAAETYALAQANLAETQSKAYADGIVSDEEARAIADAQAKADAAQAAAESTAAADATAKANAAQAAAELAAAADAEAKVAAIKIGGTNYMDGTGLPQLHANGWSESGWSGNISVDAAQNAMSFTATNGWHSMIKAIAAVSSKEITVSFEAKRIQGTANCYISKDLGYSFISQITLNDSDWTYNEFTFTAENDGEVGFFIRETDSAGLSTTMFVRGLKVEIGNKSTSWSPSPADLDAEALSKANAAQTAAEAFALAKAELAETQSKAYADGEVSAAEARAIAEAQVKADAAEAAAIAAAAADATAKADAAQQAAETTAAADAQAKANLAETQAKAYADGEITDAEARAIAEAQVKADAAEAAAIAAAEADATAKANAAEANAAADATAKVDAIEVGGRNLLVNSGTQKTVTRFTSFDVFDIFSGHIGREVTISFDMKCTIARGIQVYAYQANGISIKDIKTFTVAEPNVYERFSFTTTVKDYGDNGIHSDGAVAFYDYTDVQTYYLKDIKIEWGNKATDWTPAIEDVEADAQSKADQAEANAATDATNKANTAQSNAEANAAVDATNKADAAEANAKGAAQKFSGIYEGDWNIASAGVGYDFIFSPVPSEYKDYIKLSLLQNDLEGQCRILLNDTIIVSAINGTDGVTEWKAYDVPGAHVNSTTDNTIRIEHTGGSADWGHIYKVIFEFNSKKYSEEKGSEAESFATTSINELKNNYLGDLAILDTLDGGKITDGTVAFAKLGSTIVSGGYIKTELLDANAVRANIINVGYIEGLTLNFDKGTIGGWTINNIAMQAGSVVLKNDGTIYNYKTSYLWRLNGDGSGHFADGNISWNAAGEVAFSSAVKLQWESYADDAANNIQIGGTNMLSGSNSSSEYKTITMGNYTASLLGKTYFTDLGMLPGDTVTFRLYLRASGTHGGAARVSYYKSDNTYNTKIGNYIAPGTEGYSQITFVMPTDREALFLAIAKQGSGSGTPDSTIEFKEAMFEKGNKPSVWSPSPKDYMPKVTKIDNDGIYTGTLTASQVNAAGVTVLGAVSAGSFNINNNFKVTSSGLLTATGVDINGKITATSGKIGNWDIKTNSLWHSSASKHLLIQNSETENTHAGGRRGFMMYNDNSTLPGPDSVKTIKIGMLTDPNTVNVWPATPNYGIQITKGDGTYKDIFRADANGANISGWNFDDGYLYSGDKYSGVVGDSGLELRSGTTPRVIVHSGKGYVNLYRNSDTSWGISGKDSNGGQVFLLGSENKIAGWAFDTASISKTVSSYSLRMGTLSGSSVVGFHAGTDVNNRVSVGTTGSDWGFWLTKGGSEIVRFGLNTNHISGWAFDGNRLYSGSIELYKSGRIRQTSDKWRFNNDGSGQVASGKISWDANGAVSLSPDVYISYEPNYDFSKDLTGWSNYSHSQVQYLPPVDGKVSIIDNSGATSTKSMRVEGPKDLMYTSAIPIRPGYTYTFKCRLSRRVISGSNKLYIGYTPLGRNYDLQDWNVYVSASSVTPAVNTWVTYEAELSYDQIASGSKVNTKFIRPLMLINYQGGGSDVTYIDYYEVKELNSELVTTITNNTISTANLNASNITSGTLNAARIATGSLNGDRITAGTITSTQVNVSNLQAALVTVDKIEGLELNFTKGSIGDFDISSTSIQTKNWGTSTADNRMRMDSALGRIEVRDSSNAVSYMSAEGILANSARTNVLPLGQTLRASIGALGFGNLAKDQVLTTEFNNMAGLYASASNSQSAANRCPTYAAFLNGPVYQKMQMGGAYVSTSLGWTTSSSGTELKPFQISTHAYNIFYCSSTSGSKLYVRLPRTNTAEQYLPEGTIIRIGTMGRDIGVVAHSYSRLRWDNNSARSSGTYSITEENRWTAWVLVAGAWSLMHNQNL